MFSRILIIDKRKELSTKYKKTVEHDGISAVIARTPKDALFELQDSEPDLIIISDSIDEPLATFCQKIRTLTYNTRPIIVALSKSAEINDRIMILESGADDFLSEPVNFDEFKSRINAHLRRDLEYNLDNKTLLPNERIVRKSIKRILNQSGNHAVLFINIVNLESYKSIYTEVAGDKLIQTFVAITKSTLENEDFFGQIDDTHFIIITNIYSAEKIAAFLTFAFDTVAPKFYSETDAKRGYMLLKGDRMAGMRADFVSIQIGGIVDKFEQTDSVEGLLERLYSISKLAKIPSGSNYIIDRVRLSGENSVEENLLSNTIYIKEPDEALSLLLRTSLELQGYDVTEAIDTENSSQPGILILDSSDDLSGLGLCKELKQKLNFANSKIIVTTTIHNKSVVLDSGADLYLPKPYEISDLIGWIEYFKKINT